MKCRIKMNRILDTIPDRSGEITQDAARMKEDHSHDQDTKKSLMVLKSPLISILAIF